MYYDSNNDYYINIETYRIYYWYGEKTGQKKKESALQAGLNNGSIQLVDRIFVGGCTAYFDYLDMGYEIDQSFE